MLLDKVNASIATFRREAEQAKCQKHLAQERLRLVQQEVSAAETTVGQLEQQLAQVLQQLQKATSTTASNDDPDKTKVEQLQRQVSEVVIYRTSSL